MLTIGKVGPLDQWTGREREEWAKRQWDAAAEASRKRDERMRPVACECGHVHQCPGKDET